VPPLYTCSGTSRLCPDGTAVRGPACELRVHVRAFCKKIIRAPTCRGDPDRAGPEEKRPQPGQILMFSMMTIILGSTDARRRRNTQTHRRHINPARRAGVMSGWTGVDFRLRTLVDFRSAPRLQRTRRPRAYGKRHAAIRTGWDRARSHSKNCRPSAAAGPVMWHARKSRPMISRLVRADDVDG